MTEHAPDSSASVELAESLSMAFLVMLERLSPIERAVLLLHDVFDFDYAEIARIVDKSEANCRQLLSRAKKHVVADEARFDADREQAARLTQRFTDAAGEGNLDGMLAVLAEDITLWADGGGKVAGAALRPIHGADAVARFIASRAERVTSARSDDAAGADQRTAGLRGVCERATDDGADLPRARRADPDDLRGGESGQAAERRGDGRGLSALARQGHSVTASLPGPFSCPSSLAIRRGIWSRPRCSGASGHAVVCGMIPGELDASNGSASPTGVAFSAATRSGLISAQRSGPALSGEWNRNNRRFPVPSVSR